MQSMKSIKDLKDFIRLDIATAERNIAANKKGLKSRTGMFDLGFLNGLKTALVLIEEYERQNSPTSEMDT